MADLLRRNRVDLKTAQELLRHANPRILLEIYQQTVTEERRAAQTLAFGSIWAVTPFLSACQAIEPIETHGGLRKKRLSAQLLDF